MNLILELGCEDLPSWTGEYLDENWLPAMKSILSEYRVEYGRLYFFHSPRRLILYVKNIAEKQGDSKTEVYGPPVEAAIDKDGNYTKAAEGFAASRNMSIEDLQTGEKKGRKVLMLVVEEKGESVEKIVGDVVNESLRKLEIPRGMVWSGNGTRFIRPVRWIFAKLGTKTLNLQVAGVKSGSHSYGHRVLAPGKFTAATPEEYMDKLLKRFVIFDPAVRAEFISAVLEKEMGETCSFSRSALKEISCLVEYPVVKTCNMGDSYKNLPGEVISAVIKNLRGLPLFRPDGSLHSSYALVLDGADGGESIKENYHSVLDSKMQDAAFFIDKDTSKPLAGYANDLKKIVYHPRWGSVYERVERFKKIAGLMMPFLNAGRQREKDVLDIMGLCKNDLATLMVAEFPELEGVIGRIYAERDGCSSIVASGIEQHYLPRFAGDRLPDTVEASVASAVMRIETICGFFADNVKIKGAGDPYGIKRTATGLIDIIWTKKLDFPIDEIIAGTLELFSPGDSDALAETILSFIFQRVENMLAAEGITSGIRRAIVSSERSRLVPLREKTDALKQFVRERGQAQKILVPFIRVANILKHAEEKGIVPGSFDEKLLVDDTEKELFAMYRAEEQSIRKLYADSEYESFLACLSRWREIIDRFFDDILVMCDDERLRDNRLGLLKRVNELFTIFADFSLIPIAEVDNA